MIYQFKPSFTIRMASDGEHQYITLSEEEIDVAISILKNDSELVEKMRSHSHRFRYKNNNEQEEFQEIEERKIIFPWIRRILLEEDEKYMPFSSALSEELFHRIEEGEI